MVPSVLVVDISFLIVTMAFAWRSRGLLRSAPPWSTLGSDLPAGVTSAWAALVGTLASVPQLTNLAHCRHCSASVSPEPQRIRDFAIIGTACAVTSELPFLCNLKRKYLLMSLQHLASASCTQQRNNACGCHCALRQSSTHQARQHVALQAW